jgi:hypothetical protein
MAGYTVHTPITNVSITSHSDGDIVFVGCDYTLTCTTSTDKDCHDGTHTHSDPVVHTWSGPGTFEPTTGTSVTWTAPCTAGDVDICVTASDNGSPVYANDTDKSDCITVTVQSTIYVDEDATAGNDDGTTWTNAFLKLQDALDVACCSAAEIWVAEGTYKPSSKIDPNDSRSATFKLVADVEHYGGFDPTVGDDTWPERDWINNVATLSGDIGTVDVDTDNSYNVVTGTGDSNTIIDGFTITKGNANVLGTGQAYTETGGGMFNWDVSPTVANCTFTDNKALTAGALLLLVETGSVQTVTDCVLSGNSAQYYAGAIWAYTDNNHDGQALVTNCVITGNSADLKGGGIFNFDASSNTYTNCVITGNYSPKGGGLHFYVSNATFTNCTIVDNDANQGGGMYTHWNCDPNFTNCIFWDNHADDDANDGGEIYNEDDNCDPTLSDCDIEGGINGSKCGGYDSVDGGGNINSDPSFEDASDPDGSDNVWANCDDGLYIDANSPCMDTGDNSAISEPNDITGNTRKIDGDQNGSTIVDMGAYEYDPNQVCAD